MTGQRFVLVVGPVWETYPDIPESAAEMGGIVLWDRQQKRPVFTLHSDYANAICLEQTNSPARDMVRNYWPDLIDEEGSAPHALDQLLGETGGGCPFTALESWFNNTSADALASEGIE